VKRVFEWLLFLLSLPLLLPLGLVCALLVGIFLGRPILFRQPRGGLNGVPFPLYKFRTMLDARGPDGAPLPDSERLTRFGAFLRSTSLDELPSFLNFVRGDMAIVGPRPFMAEYLPLYSPEQARRHSVRPGMTGWAQVKGRNELSWDEKFALDCWYVDNRSLWLDIRIMALTVVRVLGRQGINQDGQIPDRFTG